jgi:LemA protein
MRYSLAGVLLIALTVNIAGCGINNIPSYDEQVKAAWSQVQNQYKRRADLVPNLVATVKGYASHEHDTLVQVTEARAKVGSMQLPENLPEHPEAFKKYAQAQKGLTGALRHLMVVSERYPDLKANQNFLTLQSQLEGTENRISVARRDYIQAVQKYNTELRTIPGRWYASMFYPDAKVKQNFTTEKANFKAPKVNFQS